MAQANPGTEIQRTALRMAEVGAELATTAVTFVEMSAAAQTTIALRMLRLGETLANPARLADPEFRRMGQEKVVATSQAAFALAEGVRVVQDGLWDWAAIQATAWERLGMELATARDPMVFPTAVSRFTDRSLDAAETAASHVAMATSRLAGLGLAPLHRATRANARRLTGQARLAKTPA